MIEEETEQQSFFDESDVVEDAPAAFQRRSLSEIIAAAKPTQKESFLRGGLQGASMGFADEIEGAVKAPFSDKSYKDLRDMARAEYKAAEEANPKTFMAGDLTASVATPGGIVKGLSKVSKAKNLLDSYKNLSKVKKAASLGALGAAEGVGRGEAEGATGMTGDAFMGTAAAGLGGLAGAAGSKLAKSIGDSGNIKKLTQKSQQLLKDADERALRGIDAPAKSFSRGLKNITSGRQMKPEDYTGAVGLREGIISTSTTPQEAYSKSLDFLDKVGEGYEQNLGYLKDYAVKEADQALEVADEVHTKLVAELQEEFRNDAITQPQEVKVLKVAEKLKDDLQTAFLSENPLREMHDLYKQFNDIAFSNRQNPTANAYRQIRNNLKSVQRGLISELEPDTAKKLTKLDKEYTAALELKGLTEDLHNQSARKGANIGLADWVGMGVLSGLTGIPGVGPAYLGATQAIKRTTGRDLDDLLPIKAGQKRMEYYQNTLDKIQKLKDRGVSSQSLTSKNIDALGSNLSQVTTPGLAGARAAQTVGTDFEKNYVESQSSFQKSNPSEIEGYMSKVSSEYGKDATDLLQKLNKAKEGDRQQRQRHLFSILQDSRYRKMLNVSKDTEK